MKRYIILFLTIMTACQQSYGITDKLGGFLHPWGTVLKLMFGSILVLSHPSNLNTSPGVLGPEPTPTPSHVFIPSEWKGYGCHYDFFLSQV